MSQSESKQLTDEDRLKLEKDAKDIDYIMTVLKNQNKAPGHRSGAQPIKQQINEYSVPSTDRFASLEHRYGKRAKQVLDKHNRSFMTQSYHSAKEIQSTMLNAYENMEWWERDSRFDLIKHDEKAQ